MSESSVKQLDDKFSLKRTTVLPSSIGIYAVDRRFRAVVHCTKPSMQARKGIESQIEPINESQSREDPRTIDAGSQPRTLIQVALVAFILLVSSFVTWRKASAQDLPWEYDPYRMRVWLSLDPAIAVEPADRDDILREITREMDLVFQAAANVDAQTAPRSLFSRVLRELDGFSIDRILDNEFVLVLGRNHPATKEIRTIETLQSSGIPIFATPPNLGELKRELESFANEPNWKSILEKLQPGEGTHDEFMARLKNDEIPAAFIRRFELAALGRSVRFVPTRLPWQVDTLLKSHDKIMAVSVSQSMDLFRIQLREIDCRLRVVGPMLEAESPSWEMIPRQIAFASQQAFAPMGRIEEADIKHCVMRLRAGGLITSDNHPAKFVAGDVLQPFVRRDDRNGVPTLLQSVPWTYVAIAETDGVSAKSAIYSGIRSALAGRKNRRTQKLCLRVRVVHDASELRMGVLRDTNATFAGAEVYQRTPGKEDLNLVGRADWRGIVRIDDMRLPTATYELPIEPEVTSESNAASKAEVSKASELKDDTASAPVKAPAMRSGEVKLRAPLYNYYVKNGNVLLARLPMVTGFMAMESVDLPDDRRRLESEAFVKGVQGEILDVVARRQILASRIKQAINEKSADKAKSLLEELRREKAFDTMTENLNAIQRRILSTDRGPITPGTQKRIDQMFDLTRQMIQRYLQDNLLRDLEVSVGQL